MAWTVTYLKKVGQLEQWQVTELATAAKRLSRKAEIKIVNGWAQITNLLAVNEKAEEVLCNKYGFSKVYDYEVES